MRKIEIIEEDVVIFIQRSTGIDLDILKLQRVNFSKLKQFIVVFSFPFL